MKISNRGRDPKRFVSCATAPLGRVICILDKRPTDVEEAHKEILQKGMICMQIGKFGHTEYDTIGMTEVWRNNLCVDSRTKRTDT